MTGYEIANAVKELSGAIGVASSEIIPHYARWCVFASIGYMMFGLCLCAGSILGFRVMARYVKSNVEDYDQQGWRVWAGIILTAGLFIGGLIFFCQIGDLFAPQGMAIHRLIQDIRG